MATHNTTFGRQGEDAAADWYRSAGYRIIDRNWRCPRGEIDLIVDRDDAITFVEVKARSSGRYGSGFDAVDRRKQQRLRNLARLWLAQSGSDGRRLPYYREIAFDVVDVDATGAVDVRHRCF